MTVTGVVLAAGLSRRLGQPKQLLPYRDTTLLGATVEMANSCGFDQLIVAARRGMAVACADGVVVDDSCGTASTLRIALSVVDPRADGIVVLLGDQPGVAPSAVRTLLGAAEASVAVCRYNDGIGHPFWLHRRVFGELATLSGDRVVRRLTESGVAAREVLVDAPVPLDVDTWDDYRALIAPTRLDSASRARATRMFAPWAQSQSSCASPVARDQPR